VSRMMCRGSPLNASSNSKTRTCRSVIDPGRPPGWPPAASSSRHCWACCRMPEESTNAATALKRFIGKPWCSCRVRRRMRTPTTPEPWKPT